MPPKKSQGSNHIKRGRKGCITLPLCTWIEEDFERSMVQLQSDMSFFYDRHETQPFDFNYFDQMIDADFNIEKLLMPSEEKKEPPFNNEKDFPPLSSSRASKSNRSELSLEKNAVVEDTAVSCDTPANVEDRTYFLLEDEKDENSSSEETLRYVGSSGSSTLIETELKECVTKIEDHSEDIVDVRSTGDFLCNGETRNNIFCEHEKEELFKETINFSKTKSTKFPNETVADKTVNDNQILLDKIAGKSNHLLSELFAKDSKLTNTANIAASVISMNPMAPEFGGNSSAPKNCENEAIWFSQQQILEICNSNDGSLKNLNIYKSALNSHGLFASSCSISSTSLLSLESKIIRPPPKVRNAHKNVLDTKSEKPEFKNIRPSSARIERKDFSFSNSRTPKPFSAGNDGRREPSDKVCEKAISPKTNNRGKKPKKNFTSASGKDPKTTNYKPLNQNNSSQNGKDSKCSNYRRNTKSPNKNFSLSNGRDSKRKDSNLPPPDVKKVNGTNGNIFDNGFDKNIKGCKRNKNLTPENKAAMSEKNTSNKNGHSMDSKISGNTWYGKRKANNNCNSIPAKPNKKKQPQNTFSSHIPTQNGNTLNNLQEIIYIDNPFNLKVSISNILENPNQFFSRPEHSSSYFSDGDKKYCAGFNFNGPKMYQRDMNLASGIQLQQTHNHDRQTSCLNGGKVPKLDLIKDANSNSDEKNFEEISNKIFNAISKSAAETRLHYKKNNLGPVNNFGLLRLSSILRGNDPFLSGDHLYNTLPNDNNVLFERSNPLLQGFTSPFSSIPKTVPVPMQYRPEYEVNYLLQNKLKDADFNSWPDEVIFFIFYNKQRELAQLEASSELNRRNWRFHKIFGVWMKIISGQQYDINGSFVIGRIKFFDFANWVEVERRMEVNLESLDLIYTDPHSYLLTQNLFDYLMGLRLSKSQPIPSSLTVTGS